jgi:nucleoside-triphosphatase
VGGEAGVNKILLITGPRAVGKTYLCQRVVEEARETGRSCAGVLSPAVIERGERTGIRLINVATQEDRPLAVSGDGSGDVRWGKYRFVPETLEWGADALNRATPCDLLVVDEIGPLELKAGQGLVAALKVLNAGGFALAVVVVRPELIDELKDRMQSNDPQIVEVTEDNRDQLPRRIFDLLGEEIG